MEKIRTINRNEFIRPHALQETWATQKGSSHHTLSKVLIKFPFEAYLRSRGVGAPRGQRGGGEDQEQSIAGDNLIRKNSRQHWIR